MRKISPDLIFLLGLLAMLLAVYFSSFRIPPRSDYWQLFYFFHHLDQSPGQFKLLHILNYDIFEQMRYQSLSRISHYVLHLLAGPRFALFNIFNFAAYFFSMAVLYRFILALTKERKTAFISTGLTAFLFSHSDIILWSYHAYIILGLSFSLLGLVFYTEFLKSRRVSLIFLGAGSIFLGMLFYEAFFLWPLAALIVSAPAGLKTENNPAKAGIVGSRIAFLATTYGAYLITFILTRLIRTYSYPAHMIEDFLRPENFVNAGSGTLFSLLYNNIMVNIYPLLAFPLEVGENIELGGLFISLIAKNKWIIFAAGALMATLLAWLLIYLRRKRLSAEMRIAGLLIFLAFSGTYTVYFCRLVTNPLEYNLIQFRYNYISNPFIITALVFFSARLLSRSRRIKMLIYPVLALVFALNLIGIRKMVRVCDQQLSGLSRMLGGIRSGISEGNINLKDRLYLDPDLPEYLPILCWNIEMGERFIHGNYQWLFSRSEQDYFSGKMEDASWVIDKDDFSIVRKRPLPAAAKARKINFTRDDDYRCARKDDKYTELAYFYISQKRPAEAEIALKKAAELRALGEGE